MPILPSFSCCWRSMPEPSFRSSNPSLASSGSTAMCSCHPHRYSRACESRTAAEQESNKQTISMGKSNVQNTAPLFRKYAIRLYLTSVNSLLIYFASSRASHVSSRRDRGPPVHQRRRDGEQDDGRPEHVHDAVVSVDRRQEYYVEDPARPRTSASPVKFKNTSLRALIS